MSGQIVDQPEQGIDGHGVKDFEKREVLRREWRTINDGRFRTNDTLSILAFLGHCVHQTIKTVGRTASASARRPCGITNCNRPVDMTTTAAISTLSAIFGRAVTILIEASRKRTNGRRRQKTNVRG